MLWPMLVNHWAFQSRKSFLDFVYRADNPYLKNYSNATWKKKNYWTCHLKTAFKKNSLSIVWIFFSSQKCQNKECWEKWCEETIHHGNSKERGSIHLSSLVFIKVPCHGAAAKAVMDLLRAAGHAAAGSSGASAIAQVSARGPALCWKACPLSDNVRLQHLKY